MKYLPVIWTGLILSSQLVYCNEIYQSVRIFNPSPATIQLLTEAGIPLDHITGKAGVYLDIVVSESQVEKLDSNDVKHKILIHDLTQYMRAGMFLLYPGIFHWVPCRVTIPGMN